MSWSVIFQALQLDYSVSVNLAFTKSVECSVECNRSHNLSTSGCWDHPFRFKVNPLPALHQQDFPLNFNMNFPRKSLYIWKIFSLENNILWFLYMIKENITIILSFLFRFLLLTICFVQYFQKCNSMAYQNAFVFGQNS